MTTDAEVLKVPKPLMKGFHKEYLKLSNYISRNIVDKDYIYLSNPYVPKHLHGRRFRVTEYVVRFCEDERRPIIRIRVKTRKANNRDWINQFDQFHIKFHDPKQIIGKSIDNKG